MELVEICPDDDEHDEPELDSSDDNVPFSVLTQQKTPVGPEPIRTRGCPKKGTQTVKLECKIILITLNKE